MINKKLKNKIYVLLFIIIEFKRKMDKETVGQKRRRLTTRCICGLVNIGNTCYLNSALQSLFATDVFSFYLRSHKFAKDLETGIINIMAKEKRSKEGLPKDADVILKKGVVKKNFRESCTYCLYSLFSVMFSEPSEIKPVSFKACIGRKNPMFSGTEQHDSQEVLNAILNMIHDETKTDSQIDFRDVPDSVVEYQKKKRHFEKKLKDIDTDKKSEYEHKFLKKTYKYEYERMMAESYEFYKNYFSTNHSRIVDIFSGVFFTEIACPCGMKSYNFAYSYMLHLEIPKKDDHEDFTSQMSMYMSRYGGKYGFNSGKTQTPTTLEECIDSYTSTETFAKGNEYLCSLCKEKVLATRKTTFWTSPERMIIQLKRFECNRKTTHKNSTLVKFPIKGLKLDKNMSEHSEKNVTYDLYAVINHMGSLGGGHYVSYTKNPINGLWYHYDDSKCVQIPDEEVENELVTKSAYILFYKKNNGTRFDFSDSDEEK